MSEFNGNGLGEQPGDEAQQHDPMKSGFTKRQTLLVAASTVVAAALGVGCVLAVQDAFTAHAASSAQQYTSQPALGRGGSGSGYGGGGSGYGNGGYGYGGASGGLGQNGQYGYPGQGGQGSDPFGGGAYGGSSGSSGSSSGSSAGATESMATTAESRGIVLIDTQLGYQDAEAAGTGLVLTSSGEILTNNHVIEGSTAIQVEVVSTGKTYTAKVVGDDPTDDVAVLQLQGAKGLTTAKLDTSHTVSTGDAVTGVGNAEGGNQLVAAPGQVTGLDQSITTEAEGSDASESLHGLIETNAGIEPGDSGGPLYDSAGKVVGIDTAAASSGAADGYAIPITTAKSIAKKIESGTAGGNIEIGYPAFLGVELGETDASGSGAGFGSGFGSGSGSGAGFGDGSGLGGASAGASAQGAEIAGVTSDGPAEEAGLQAGDVITAVDGTSISSTDALQSALAQHAPGDRVSITWADASGQSHTASVTLATGPAA